MCSVEVKIAINLEEVLHTKTTPLAIWNGNQWGRRFSAVTAQYFESTFSSRSETSYKQHRGAVRFWTGVDFFIDGERMTQAKDATLRRIAIVLASLPESVSRRLLGSLKGDSQRHVRVAISTLSDVDPLERRRALDGFANSLRQTQSKKSTSNDAAEVVFSRAALRTLDDSPPTVEPAPRSVERQHPLSFLLDVEDEALISHLGGELPQTLAIILSSIPPTQAARVLPRLDVTARAETMRRMAKLGDVPSDVVEDIASQLRTRFASTSRSSGQGRRALDAILAEMPQAPVVPPTLKPTPPPGPVVMATKPIKPADKPAADTDGTLNIRLAPGTFQPSDEKVPAELRSTDLIHQFLVKLPAERLRDTLALVPLRQALLALCGLPNSAAEAVFASLPRSQAKQVRQQLGELGTLELREIDDAKELLAKTALRSAINNESTGSVRAVVAA